jgi:putative transposase
VAAGAPARRALGNGTPVDTTVFCATAVGAKTDYIDKGSPWENDYIESFNGKLRDDLLDGEIFYSLRKAQIVIEQWRRHYNAVRLHSSLGYRPRAPEVIVPSGCQPVAQRPPLN